MTADPDAPVKPGTFSLEGRPAPALYVVGWLLSAVGLGLLVVGSQVDPPAGTILAIVGIAVLGLGFAAAAGHQIVVRSRRPSTAFRGASPAFLLGIQIVLSLCFGAPLLLLAISPQTPFGFALASGALFLAYLVVVWLFGFRTSAITWRDLGIAERPSLGRFAGDVGTGVAATALLWPITTTLAVVLSLLLGTQPADIVPGPQSALDVALLALGAGILVPVGEELLFRGYSVTAWLKDLGPRSALIRSTLFFAVAHVLNLQAATFDAGVRQAVLTVVVITPVGAVLGWLFIRKGIVAAISGHVTFNLIAVILLTLAQLAPSR